MARRSGPMPELTPQATLERLYGFERGRSPLGLEGTRLLLEALGHPERAFRALHLAGTNGKGSTSAFLERILRAAGLETGLFTSPHLVDFRERIRVDGRCASAESITRLLDSVSALPDASGRTFFEVTTAMAFAHFATAGVEAAVIETGLGGRLDTTNVLEPVVTVLTPIDLDHTETLGTTLAEIGREKAGILKPGVPAVTATQLPEVQAVIAEAATTRQAPLFEADRLARASIRSLDRRGTDIVVQVEPWGEVATRLRLLGRHQVANAALAAATCSLLAREAIPLAAGRREASIDADVLAQGLAETRWPGRFEPCATEPRLFWDGAHNPGGARAVREAWRDVLGDPRGVLVVGFAEDKDAAAFLEQLRGPWREVIAVAARAPRAREARDVAGIVGSSWPGTPVTEADSVAAGVERALTALRPGEVALVTGSLFVVGEAMNAMGGATIECL